MAYREPSAERSPSTRVIGPGALPAACGLVLLLVLPFVTKAVHIDDTNFLRLAEGAARDPWRPHDITINWLWRTQRAFDVLSNPPGIAWWLAPVIRAPTWAQHLWMLPWLALALWGCYRLGKVFADDGAAALLILGTSPVVVLAAQSLTPDLPLLACVTAGIGGFLGARGRAWPWGLLAGSAALFRYSGFCIVPLLVFMGIRRGKVGAAVTAALPTAALFLHDLSAYGRVHAFAMAGFQAVSMTPEEIFRKGVAAMAMLGGACLLPVLPWERSRSWIFAAAGAFLGLQAAILSGHHAAQMTATVLSAGAGGVALGVLRGRGRDDQVLALWALGGLAFLLTLWFVATRYWIPFLPPLVLAALRRRPGPRRVYAAVALNVLLSFGMAVDDFDMARAYRDAAHQVAALGTGRFSGHWGWQYYMEQAGWRPLEAGAAPEGLLAVARAPSPQPHARGVCLTPILNLMLEDHWLGPRVHTAAGAANFHASEIAGSPMTDTYAPWTFSNEPYDRITVYRRCD